MLHYVVWLTSIYYHFRTIDKGFMYLNVFSSAKSYNIALHNQIFTNVYQSVIGYNVFNEKKGRQNVEMTFLSSKYLTQSLNPTICIIHSNLPTVYLMILVNSHKAATLASYLAHVTITITTCRMKKKNIGSSLCFCFSFPLSKKPLPRCFKDLLFSHWFMRLQ